MGSESWSITAKPCDSCNSAPAAVFCRADSAFLCVPCDGKVHAANKTAARHARVWVCQVCEQAPATVTCKADAAALCPACDRDIHSANPLARRHERHPMVPFYDSATAAAGKLPGPDLNDEFSEEAVEAASWLKAEEEEEPEYKSGAEYLFGDMDSYIDLDLLSGEQKVRNLSDDDDHHQCQKGNDEKQYSSDGVVPVQFLGPVVDGYPSYDMDYPVGTKPFMYNFSSQSISQSISSSSMDVGMVPDHGATADVSNTTTIKTDEVPTPVSGIDREARVMRYREKRKNRKFEKTIRYASRKAYAETRPRIKGRFAKRSEMEVESFIAADASYGVVPTF